MAYNRVVCERYREMKSNSAQHLVRVHRFSSGLQDGSEEALRSELRKKNY